jgi:hypothetical protein
MSATAGSQAWRSTCRHGERGKTPGEAGVLGRSGAPHRGSRYDAIPQHPTGLGRPRLFVAGSGRMASAETRKPGPGA